MSLFGRQIDEIRGRLLYAAILDEAWQPPLPSYRAAKNKLDQLNQVVRLNSTAMLQVSRALSAGNIKSARVKLRRIFQRMDATLHQMDKLQQDMKRQERKR